MSAALRAACLCVLAWLLGACGGASVSIGIGTGGTGTLVVAVSGLPTGVDADVTVTGPGGLTIDLTQSRTLSGLAPGTYAVTARPVSVSFGSFNPLVTPGEATVSAGASASVSVAYQAQQAIVLGVALVASGLATPVFLTTPAGDARLFIVERPGRIRIYESGALRPRPFLDISARVSTDGERGLLSMAFDPGYATNGLFYVYFTDLAGAITVERYRVSADPTEADPAPTPVLSIPHATYSNHNGGLLAFGPDGMLYIGTGDGGGGGDPDGNAQNAGALLGKLLRIDVRALPYAIPAGNPLLGQAGARPEIWALGLRNPWRFAFDPLAGLLYIADVGQDRREEVDVVPAAVAGRNYGWNVTEGGLCYPADPCDRTPLTMPLFEYDHSQGCAITGGYVYRGGALPEITGYYFYSDFCSGWLRSFAVIHDRNITSVILQRDWNLPNVGQITSFGQDGRGELYLLSADGRVHRLVRN